MKKMTIDGGTAAAHVAYAFSEVAAIYPITPSTTMAELSDEWSSTGKLNLFGQPLKITEMQSEAGAAGAVHGSLSAGALTTTFTASQGLLLMVPNMYKIAGELLPTVFHVSARSIATHALSIFGDHQDVMACRQIGFALLASGSVQEVMDLALVAHLSTLKARVPFLHFFDGFRTSHEIAKIDAIEYDEMKSLMDMQDIKDFKDRALNPEHPIQKGTAQNPDTYFQNRETANKFYQKTPEIVQNMMNKVAKVTGRKYHLFDYVGAKDATEVFVVIGSAGQTIEETITKLNKNGHKLGLIKVRLYRPFAVDAFVQVIPKSCKKMVVLDRTKEAGSIGEPLYLDVCTALYEKGIQTIQVIGGRYGLGSKEFNSSMCLAVIENVQSTNPKNHFTIGINDDITNTSLDFSKKFDAVPKGTVSCKFYGLGSDGTVGANKDSIKIIGDNTDMYAQAYFHYDSKKSGGLTISHLRFGKTPIQSAYLIDSADFIACHNPSYIGKYDMLSDLKDGGKFLLNCQWTTLEELDRHLPATMKNQIAKKKIKLYVINAIKTATELGLKGKISTVMQSAFFYINQNIIEYNKANELMKKAVTKKFFKKGDAVINMNHKAIDSAISNLVEIKVPASWATTTEGLDVVVKNGNEYFKKFSQPILNLDGDKLPTSAFNADGTVPLGTTQYEKNGTAVFIPKWMPEHCIQCNQCAFVCPHACIRPFVFDDATEKPEEFITLGTVGIKGTQYRIQVSPLDCMGCGICAEVCPGKAGNKALEMVPMQEVEEDIQNWEFAIKTKEADTSSIKRTTVKGSQFNKPYFEFSGACAGCGETPYIKVVTQMFGDRMIISNATGCSSIYGASSPTCPYTTDEKGHGPAWANSLFEDNAEHGLGIKLAYKARREKLANTIKEFANSLSGEDKTICENWLNNMENGEESKVASEAIITLCEKNTSPLAKEILAEKDCLVKKSIWIIGGDGWAYDIGYGGLDHVLASNEDVNILVLDTEVYSNTGGQASKSSPAASIAKFAASGKRIKKKDLGMMAINYGYVYVAQVSMGANKQQFLNAIMEAESYKGPSIIIAYAPCIAHGMNMSKTMDEEKKAVECGYWQLYRYNPTLKEKGQNPFILDSKDPIGNYRDFLLGETRYSALLKAQPELADKLFAESEADSKERYELYKHLANIPNDK